MTAWLFRAPITDFGAGLCGCLVVINGGDGARGGDVHDLPALPLPL